MKITRPAVLAIALTAFVPVAAPSAATAKEPTASAQRAASVCTKRAPRSTASWRRCVATLKRSATRTRDTTAPSVSWKTPTAGATVSGKVQGSACEALATDGGGIDRVVMKVDGTTLNTESDAPWNCSFDSTKVSDGAHTLSATAYDVAGNSRSASVAVTVANKAAAAPAPAPSPAPAPAPAPSPAPAGDTTAPSVSWKTPTAGATVSGKVQGSACEALATDGGGIDRVVMKVDGTTLNTESDAPWNCSFDSTKVSDGAPHPQRHRI